MGKIKKGQGKDHKTGDNQKKGSREPLPTRTGEIKSPRILRQGMELQLIDGTLRRFPEGTVFQVRKTRRPLAQAPYLPNMFTNNDGVMFRETYYTLTANGCSTLQDQDWVFTNTDEKK